MHMSSPSEIMEIPDEIMDRWQNIVDILAEMINIPAALIMRIVKTDIEVFASSRSKNNPYSPGDNEYLPGSGLYCETVIKSNKRLLVPNALADADWRDNPDIKLNMISYLGFPILLPDQTPFGTICVLDNKENAYGTTYEELIRNFRDIVQSQIELLYMNHILGEKHKHLTGYLNEIKVLRGIVPICSFCKKIRDDQNRWHDVDTYVAEHSQAEFSHGVCPVCEKEHFKGY